MIKSDRHIEVVRSSMPGLSSMSRASSDGIVGVLAKHYADVRGTIVNELSDLQALVSRKPDLVFLGMEYLPTHPALGMHDPARIWVAQYLDTHGIAYTGSAWQAHRLGRDKPLAKQCIIEAGLATSPFRVVGQRQLLAPGDVSLTFPLFIKPNNRGGGLGIDSGSVVHDSEALQAKVYSLAVELHADSLVEEYLPGREFSVAILKDEASPAYAVMPIELIAPPDVNGARILSSAVKSANSEQAVAVPDGAVAYRVSTLAISAFRALGGRDYGRIDIRLDRSGMPHFLEANLIPSLISGYGSFPKACVLNAGLDYEPMILKIARLGLTRKAYHVTRKLGPKKAGAQYRIPAYPEPVVTKS